MAKGEIAYYEYFFLATMFQKSSAAEASKCVYMRKKVNKEHA